MVIGRVGVERGERRERRGLEWKTRMVFGERFVWLMRIVGGCGDHINIWGCRTGVGLACMTSHGMAWHYMTYTVMAEDNE